MRNFKTYASGYYALMPRVHSFSERPITDDKRPFRQLSIVTRLVIEFAEYICIVPTLPHTDVSFAKSGSTPEMYVSTMMGEV